MYLGDLTSQSKLSEVFNLISKANYFWGKSFYILAMAVMILNIIVKWIIFFSPAQNRFRFEVI